MAHTPLHQAVSQGYTLNPFMQQMFDQYMGLLGNMGGPQQFMQQQSGMYQDALNIQASSARKGIAGQLSGRGMFNSGAAPAAYGQLAGQQQAALAQILPQIMQMYFQRQQQLMGGGMQAGQGMLMPPMQQQDNSGMWQGIGQLAGQLGGAAIMASDRRLKKDIKQIGTVPVYAFRYKWDSDKSQKTIGFMADEVEKVAPEMVTEMNGYRAIRLGGRR